MNIEKIDEFLARLEQATDDDHLRELFSTYSTSFDENVPADPFSMEYRNKQFSLYERLAGKTYSTANEESKFDVEQCAISPFPYCHGSGPVTGDQLMAIGFVLKALNLPRGSRVLEFGPGWGNTTLALAKMGHKVTAVDIESNFIELIRRRASMEKLNIELICDDFSYINHVTEPYDAVLFFECFHHASDHLAIISGFEKAVKKGGIVCFAAEPITDDFPIPWGLRMDGQSLWAIRKNGWLELGFNSKYFNAALARFGWSAAVHSGIDGPMSNALLAKRTTEWGGKYIFTQNQLHNQVGTLVSNALQTNGSEEGYVAYGPYIDLPKGSWSAELLFDASFSNTGKIFVDVVSNNGSVRVADEKQFLVISSSTNPCVVNFDTHERAIKLEIRVRCLKGSKIRLNGIELRHLSAHK
jgi:2-polyprenyl-3-methyl-5-hydroxy-6-metoxy-1,4-benzoquinol methylase